jgi:transposase-like protein
VLVELSVMEQRYQAVLAVVQDGWQVSEVARRLGVSRQSVHAWIVRYEHGGLAALADRSHRPGTCPHQTLRSPFPLASNRRFVERPSVLRAEGCHHSTMSVCSSTQLA